MKILIPILLVAAAFVPGGVKAAETQAVSEVFWCTLREGKDWSDFEETNKFFGQQMKKIGGKADDFNAYAWRPLRSDVEFTYLWNGFYDNVRTWGESVQATLDSKEGQAADEKWGELETCGSALLYVEQIYDSAKMPPAQRSKSGAVIESFRCQLQPDKTLADLDQTLKAWHKHMSALDLPVDIYKRTPMVSSADVTHSYFSAHENAAAYGANITAYQTHPGTPAIEASLAQVQSCKNALWLSTRAFTAPE